MIILNFSNIDTINIFFKIIILFFGFNLIKIKVLNKLFFKLNYLIKMFEIFIIAVLK